MAKEEETYAIPGVTWLKGDVGPDGWSHFELRGEIPSVVRSFEFADATGLLSLVGIRHVSETGEVDDGPSGGPLYFQTFRDAVSAWAKGKTFGPHYGIEFRVVNPTLQTLKFIGVAMAEPVSAPDHTGERVESGEAGFESKYHAIHSLVFGAGGEYLEGSGPELAHSFEELADEIKRLQRGVATSDQSSRSADELEVMGEREELKRRSRKEAESVISAAGFEVMRVWELANQYWPPSPRYDDCRTPWWLFLTTVGPISIGWRKRVIEIRWDACAGRGIVTLDDVTKDDALVHARSVEKAVEYLRALRPILEGAMR